MLLGAILLLPLCLYRLVASDRLKAQGLAMITVLITAFYDAHRYLDVFISSYMGTYMNIYINSLPRFINP